jgi:hypothetical protein
VFGYPTNIEFHVFQTRNGLWLVRVDGLGPQQLYLGKDRVYDYPPGIPEGIAHGYISPSAALNAAAEFVRTYKLQTAPGYFIMEPVFVGRIPERTEHRIATVKWALTDVLTALIAPDGLVPAEETVESFQRHLVSLGFAVVPVWPLERIQETAEALGRSSLAVWMRSIALAITHLGESPE